MLNVTKHIARLGLSWPLLIGVFISLAWIIQPVSPFLLDPDTYWHIATGDWILSHAAIPTFDPFSHTMPGPPWLASEWLSDVIFAVVQRATGWNGLVFLSIACGAVTIALVARFLFDRMPALYAFVFLILTYATLTNHLLARPHILAWPLLVIWVSRLVQATEQNTPPPWWLLGIMVLWTNLHGSFILGLVITIPLAIGTIVAAPVTQQKKLTIIWIRFAMLATLAAMCSPHSWHGLGLIFEIIEINQLQRITEWQSADFTSLNPLETWISALLALSCLGYLRLPIMRLVLLLGVLHMALSHSRYISIFGLLTPLLIATAVGECYRARATEASTGIKSPHRLLQIVANPASARATATSLCLVFLMGLLSPLIHERTPDLKNTPSAALDQAKASGLTRGIIFNDYSFGGYLIYRGIPAFVDGRVVGGNATITTYLSIHDSVSKQQFASGLDKAQITWTLLPTGSLLASFLDELPEWHRVFADDIAVVHARRPLQ
ncbi:hypothetical protein [uncultured Thiodictyon sp.]|uniref:hypothetical protein n=1 Tax=uncultured Thiodictyon sp. TaxID=1846217 RepID=UPI0025EAB445|nr:hypothetical protein [uncultured Thiodictyon sp.]